MKEIKTGKGFTRNLAKLLGFGVKNKCIKPSCVDIEIHGRDVFSITVKMDYVKSDAKAIDELFNLFENRNIYQSEERMTQLMKYDHPI